MVSLVTYRTVYVAHDTEFINAFPTKITKFAIYWSGTRNATFLVVFAGRVNVDLFDAIVVCT